MSRRQQQRPLLVWCGSIEHGEKRGRALGFPTANIAFSQGGVAGTYAGLAIIEGKQYRTAVHVNESRKLLEAHLLDFSEDVYGKEMTLELYKQVARTEAFVDMATLQAKIARDVELVKKYFSE